MSGGWGIGIFTLFCITAMIFGVRWEVKREFDQRRKMIRMSSWDGSGEGVHCGMCGEPLNERTIRGMDEDGNAYCAKHTRRKGEKP